MTARIRTFDEFWVYYLGEHADPTTRSLHFLGTTGFIASVFTSLWFSPVLTMAALCASVAVVGIASLFVEPHRASFLPGALVITALIAAAPTIMPFGIVFAYTCAWVGHFNFEGNKPATFKYPVWSLICDLRMYGRMCTGQLWRGDLREVSPV